ncbi:MAG: ABC transporter permease subunit [Cellulosilyticaceae bacterium]
MLNLLRADWLKLKWSKLPWITLLAVLGLLLIYISAGEAAFMSSGNHRELLGEGIGFVSGYYGDIQKPLLGEVIRTALSYTAFFWLLILIFSIQFYAKEYTGNTIKLAIAYGHSRVKIYLSKVIVILIYSAITYSTFILGVFTHASISINYQVLPTDIPIILGVVILNYLVMIVFILITLLLCMIIKNTGIVAASMCFYTIGGAIVYMSEYYNLLSNQVSLPVKVFIGTHPMYYWMTISAYNFNNNIINETIIYGIAASIILFTTSCMYLRKQEVK